MPDQSDRINSAKKLLAGAVLQDAVYGPIFRRVDAEARGAAAVADGDPVAQARALLEQQDIQT